jgi:hypothetical protein
MAFGPCNNWPVIFSCETSSQTPESIEYAVASATEILYNLSGQQFGTCTSTLRPCRRYSYTSPWPSAWREWPLYGGWTYPQPALIAGSWFNLTCGSCGNSCTCNSLSEVRLPDNILTVTEVRVDGSPLATGSYRLDDGHLLVRTDGERWPRDNNLALADTEVGTWSVTAEYGQPVPILGQLAMGELACQLLKAINGEDCQLPKYVQSVARQGVSIVFPAVQEFLKAGRTGLYISDFFLDTVNPNKLRKRSRTYSVEGISHRRVGT